MICALGVTAVIAPGSRYLHNLALCSFYVEEKKQDHLLQDLQVDLSVNLTNVDKIILRTLFPVLSFALSTLLCI